MKKIAKRDLTPKAFSSDKYFQFLPHTIVRLYLRNCSGVASSVCKSGSVRLRLNLPVQQQAKKEKMKNIQTFSTVWFTECIFKIKIFSLQFWFIKAK